MNGFYFGKFHFNSPFYQNMKAYTIENEFLIILISIQIVPFDD